MKTIDYTQGEKPDSAYATWKKDWEPPLPRPMAMPGKLFVEFSPYGREGAIWTPERVSSNAKVVSDGNELRPSREGYIPAGTEICYTGIAGAYFTHKESGRVLCCIQKKDVEMVLE